MARSTLRDDLAREQAALTVEVLSLRGGERQTAATLVRAWEQAWDPGQRRAAAQLAEIQAGERRDLAELLVAVRTLRGLRRA
jgi:glutamate dehydrogenase